MDKNIYLYGREEALPERKILHAGNLEMIYENGFLRYIKLEGDEVLRMIYFAVRDHDWGTVEGDIQNEKFNIDEDHFDITYRSIHKRDHIHIIFDCHIQGDREGRIIFTIKGEALSSFRKNRIGFCVLHPLKECVGSRCLIAHWQGDKSEKNFPELISPHQPFQDIRSMEWSVNDRFDAKISFEGDIFESEDQRNWTDASYKTYCTPLAIPFPVEVFEGDRIEQQVILEIKRTSGVKIRDSKEEESLRIQINDSQAWSLPEIGTQASSVYDKLDDKSAARLKLLDLKHVRFDLDLARPVKEEQIGRIVQHERKTGIPVDFALFFDHEPEKEWDSLVKRIKGKIPRTNRFFIFDKKSKTTTRETIDKVVNKIRKVFPHSKIGAGTNVYFTELNRERVDPDRLDFLVYSLNPQVHAFDEASLAETLEAQYHTLISAHAFSGGKNIVVSPVTLKPRFNPNATGPQPKTPPGELPGQVDPRQMSLFGAAWTLGSLKYLTEGKAEAITFYETAGWRGILQGPEDSPLPQKFRADAGDVFPMYQVFLWISELQGLEMIKLRSTQPLRVDGLGFKKEDQFILLLSNFMEKELTVRVENQDQFDMRIKILGPGNVRSFIRDPSALQKEQERKADRIKLPEFSVSCIRMKRKE